MTNEPQSLNWPRQLVQIRLVRELLIVIAFCLFTAVLTWPYVTRLHDVVVDPGDPYLIAWILWWDFHGTFTTPLHLFDANLFYPLRYTLAFSEHSYGISLLFFPLYALGLKPLTVHAVALFFGFSLSGYGAFRLGRTLTGLPEVGWVAGIVFAFVPYRYQMMSQVAYLFTPWIPLIFEALVIFARDRSLKYAVWLGVAFFMTGLTTISWFNLSLIPLAIYAAILLTRYRIWREREFWQRGAIAVAFATVLLLPFMVPYVLASRLYHFTRSIEEIRFHSALPIHWLAVERRNQLWRGLGDGIPDSWRFKLFPGLLPILFSLAALLLNHKIERPITQDSTASTANRERWARRLDVVIVILVALSVPVIGFEGTPFFHKLFYHRNSDYVLSLLTITIISRLCLAYPKSLLTKRLNLIETIRSERRSDCLWLGSLLTVIGFFYSLGWNFFFYRICYDLIPTFRSMRVVSRGSIFAYLGLALLSGIGVQQLAQRLSSRLPRLRQSVITVLACLLLLIELNAAPMELMRGQVDPDGVTIRLKQTPMRGGIVVLPAGPEFNHRYVLRAADHQKPLIVGTSGFNSPIEDRIEFLTHAGPISSELLDLFESVPASYVVVENQSIEAERKADYQDFLTRGLTTGRLRFINRFDGHSDLYAVVKTEPESRTEAAPSLDLSVRDWAAKIADDRVNLLGQSTPWSQTLYRLELASTGTLPRFDKFVPDLELLARGIMWGSENHDQKFAENLRLFAEGWIRREPFAGTLGKLNPSQYVDRLLANAGIELDPAERGSLISGLENGADDRPGVLLKIVSHPRFVQKENNRSLLLLHYFAYLERNPGDPPDRDLSGFTFWLADLERNHDPQKLREAFQNSIEYQQRMKKKV